jgi:hypothetical protein
MLRSGEIVATLTAVPESHTPERSSTWRCSCEWNGRTFEPTSRRGASYSLCRELVAAGCPDQAMRVIDHAGKLQFVLRSVHAAAGRTVTEGVSTRIREVPYQAHMRAGMHGNAQNRGRSPNPVPQVPLDRSRVYGESVDGSKAAA